MKFITDIIPASLTFKQPAGTSRGVYTKRPLWYITITDALTGNIGIGECAPLPDLSCDRGPDYLLRLQKALDSLTTSGSIDYDLLRDSPSMLMGIETAFFQLNASSSFRLFDSPFTRGEKEIQINGLVWMGTYDEMFSRIQEKQRLGFHCIKLKIGAIDFEKELDLIRFIRSNFSSSDIELRLDANGAFSPDNALDKLHRLAQYDIHSIEQPVKAGQWDVMSRLCSQSPIPIALDEELIGVNDPSTKARLLDAIHPSYIILKPSLHGGFHGSDEWISLAKQRNIGFWTTSALESNIGLNAIAQWASTHQSPLPQGLGTGQLFTDNFPMPLSLKGQFMHFDSSINPSCTDFISWANSIRT